jgi:hypothetical protein
MSESRQKTTAVAEALAGLAGEVKLSLVRKCREFGRLSVDATGPETVHLSGPLHSFYLRQLAVVTAKQVAGVRFVSDGIHVQG